MVCQDPLLRKRSSQTVRWPSACPEFVLKLNEVFSKAIDGPFTQVLRLSSNSVKALTP